LHGRRFGSSLRGLRTFSPGKLRGAQKPSHSANVEIDDIANSFMITASAKVLVAQYMEGQTAGGDHGDPAMTLAVPVEQFRSSYMFHAPTTYTSNYVDITAPAAANDGNHSITGTAAFGVTVYGYGQFTSYWYPGGLNLTSVID
jgi:hypothetical protein